MKPNLERSQQFRQELLNKTAFIDDEQNLDTDTESDKSDSDEQPGREMNFENVARNPSTIQKRTYNPPSSNVAVSFIANDEIGKGRSKFYNLRGGKGLQAVCDLNPEYDPLQFRNNNF